MIINLKPYLKFSPQSTLHQQSVILWQTSKHYASNSICNTHQVKLLFTIVPKPEHFATCEPMFEDQNKHKLIICVKVKEKDYVLK